MAPRAVPLLFVLVLASGSCSYGGGNVPDFSVALDVRGATNTACTLTVAHGDRHVVYTIAAPPTPLPNTSIAMPAPPTRGGCGPDAGAIVDVAISSAPSDGVDRAQRTATQLCVEGGSGLMHTLGYDENSSANCPVTLHLECGGVVLYDAASWTACVWLG